MERRKGRREDGVGLQWNHGKGGGREDEGDESGAMKGREGGRRKGWGWEWSHGKKGGRELRVESTILYMSPHRGEKLL